MLRSPWTTIWYKIICVAYTSFKFCLSIVLMYQRSFREINLIISSIQYSCRFNLQYLWLHYVYADRIGQLTHVTILVEHVTAHIHLTRGIFGARCYPDPHTHEIRHAICSPCLQSADITDINAQPWLLCDQTPYANNQLL